MIKLITGDTATFTFSIIFNGAVDGIENPDLSFASVVFAMKKSGATKVAVEKTIVHPESNIVYFSLSPEETAKLSIGNYSACCKVCFDDGDAKTVWMGDIIVIKGVFDG